MDKQQISQKVAKIREVVKGVSTNDIILALHSYDMNVERTIQAFCDDGASGALDDWVTPAGATKNKNKKKKGQARPVETSQAVSVEVKPAVKVPAAPTVSAPAPLPATISKPVINGAPQKPKPMTSGSNDISSPAKNHVQNVFKALRSALNDREKAILSQNGDSTTLDPSHLLALIASFGNASVKSPVTTTESKPKAHSPVVPNGGAAIKHATSQSSISSSIGADSGVNLSPTHKEEKKVSQIASGGIQMSSDGLSAEQLAELQRSFEQSLAARGIDASVLSGVTSGDMPVRSKPRKQQTSKPKENKGKAPQISILP